MAMAPRDLSPGALDFLSVRHLATLTTLRPDGTPHVTPVGFTWDGCDEGDQVQGKGSAELLDDGSIEIEFAYRNGDEAVLKAKRETSSTAC